MSFGNTFTIVSLAQDLHTYFCKPLAICNFQHTYVCTYVCIWKDGAVKKFTSKQNWNGKCFFFELSENFGKNNLAFALNV
jgi:hypothetical protein